MFIKSIEVKNFKSFKELKLEPGKLNILIGSNASGKTNTVKIFQFFRDIVVYGLDDAISLQGGIEYFKNMKMQNEDKVFFKLVIGLSEDMKRLTYKRQNNHILTEIYELSYEFELNFQKQDLKKCEDKLEIFINFYNLQANNKDMETSDFKDKLFDKGKIIISRREGKIETDFHRPENIEIEEKDIHSLFTWLPFDEVSSYFPGHKNAGNDIFTSLLIEEKRFYLLINQWFNILEEIKIYDFYPGKLKESGKIAGLSDLEEHGENLSIVLKNLIKDKEKKRMFKNLINYILPFINDVNVVHSEDKSLLIKLQEEYFKDYLPAFLLSDGTVNITALIIALYFESNRFILIEEPERNIHPHLISKIAGMLRDASQHKQIIVTTHNPEMIKHAELNDILLVSRDKEGFSCITKPAQKEEIKIFLENEIGIEELYIQNLLES